MPCVSLRFSLTLLLAAVSAVVMAQPQPAEPHLAESLVGEWQVLKIGDRPIVAGAKSVWTFTKDGKHHVEHSGVVPATKHSGTFRLTGRVLDTVLDQNGKPQAGRMQIVSVSKEKLFLLNTTPGDEQKVIECSRLKGN